MNGANDPLPDAVASAGMPEARPEPGGMPEERAPAPAPADGPWFVGPPRWVGAWEAHGWADHAAVALTLMFVDGKFITLLSIVFGAGLAIQADRARAAGRPFVGYYLRRMALLFLIGLAHGLLLWFGNILSSYAIVGTGALFLGRLGRRGLRWCVVGCLAWAYGVLFLYALLLVILGERASSPPPRDPAVMGRQMV